MNDIELSEQSLEAKIASLLIDTLEANSLAARDIAKEILDIVRLASINRH